MKKKDKKTKSEEFVVNKKTNDTDNAGENVTVKKGFYTQTWFLASVCVVAFVTVLAVLIITAVGGDLSFKNLFAKYDGDLDFTIDSLDPYINIKESDYKGYEIEIPIRKPGEIELQTKLNELLATNRGNATEGKDTTYTGKPIAIGDDINMSYLGYEFDEAGRMLLVSGASNYENGNFKLDRYTVGLNASIFGVGFENELVGKKPNGSLEGAVRASGKVLDGNVIFATVSFVLDNGLVYDEVDVCIDPASPDFERLWGIGAYEELLSLPSDKYDKMMFGMIVLTGDKKETFELEGGGTITYTALTLNYVTSPKTAPITVETYYPADYTIEALQNKTIYYDVYIKNVIKYNVPEFNDAFVTEKLGLTEEKLANFEGETLTDRCKSYYMQMINDTYEDDCKAYLEIAVWNRLYSVVRVGMYPDKEIDRLYLAELEAYTMAMAEANANGAGYSDVDDYMPIALGLDEGAEWTSYLLELVKRTVKERLIIYSVLRKEGILPTGEEFEALYEKELRADYERAIALYPGSFSSIEDYEEYIYEERGKDEYIHDVYYYYATEKLIEYVVPVYSES